MFHQSSPNLDKCTDMLHKLVIFFILAHGSLYDTPM
uniref:Uncharacterized protein n=1 Tax=Arundo donax TaxID=35708 RepID=A0A0A8YPV2_ARUDO